MLHAKQEVLRVPLCSCLTIHCNAYLLLVFFPHYLAIMFSLRFSLCFSTYLHVKMIFCIYTIIFLLITLLVLQYYKTTTTKNTTHIICLLFQLILHMTEAPELHFRIRNESELMIT